MSDGEILKFGLTYHGGLADSHLLDFYDASQAFSGLHRSLALTTHLIINEAQAGMDEMSEKFKELGGEIYLSADGSVREDID